MQPFCNAASRMLSCSYFIRQFGCYKFSNIFTTIWTFKYGDAIGLRAKKTRTSLFWVILTEAKTGKLTEARLRVWDDFEWILVKETFALVTVLPRGVVLAVLTNTTADTTTGLVHGHVKVASDRMAIAVTPWKKTKQNSGIFHTTTAIIVVMPPLLPIVNTGLLVTCMISVPHKDYTSPGLVLYSWGATSETYNRAGPYTWKSTYAGE